MGRLSAGRKGQLDIDDRRAVRFQIGQVFLSSIGRQVNNGDLLTIWSWREGEDAFACDDRRCVALTERNLPEIAAVNEVGTGWRGLVRGRTGRRYQAGQSSRAGDP